MNTIEEKKVNEPLEVPLDETFWVETGKKCVECGYPEYNKIPFLPEYNNRCFLCYFKENEKTIEN